MSISKVNYLDIIQADDDMVSRKNEYEHNKAQKRLKEQCFWVIHSIDGLLKKIEDILKTQCSKDVYINLLNKIEEDIFCVNKTILDNNNNLNKYRKKRNDYDTAIDALQKENFTIVAALSEAQFKNVNNNKRQNNLTTVDNFPTAEELVINKLYELTDEDVNEKKLLIRYNIAKEYNESNLNKLIFYKDELEKLIKELEANSQRSENKPNPYFQKNINSIYVQVREFGTAKVFANALYNIGVKKEDVTKKFENLFEFNTSRKCKINWKTLKNDYLRIAYSNNENKENPKDSFFKRDALIAELKQIFENEGFNFDN